MGLERIGLVQYLTNFAKNGYDTMEFVRDIYGVNALLDIGIVLKGHQTKLMHEIRKLQEDDDDDGTNEDEEGGDEGYAVTQTTMRQNGDGGDGKTAHKETESEDLYQYAAPSNTKGAVPYNVPYNKNDDDIVDVIDRRPTLNGIEQKYENDDDDEDEDAIYKKGANKTKGSKNDT